MLKKLTNPFVLIAKELKRVEWLSLSQTIKSTLIVLAISVFVGIIIVILDILFFNLRDIILAI